MHIAKDALDLESNQGHLICQYTDLSGLPLQYTDLSGLPLPLTPNGKGHAGFFQHLFEGFNGANISITMTFSQSKVYMCIGLGQANVDRSHVIRV